jgi:hypothetical protein
MPPQGKRLGIFLSLSSGHATIDPVFVGGLGTLMGHSRCPTSFPSRRCNPRESCASLVSCWLPGRAAVQPTRFNASLVSCWLPPRGGRNPHSGRGGATHARLPKLPWISSSRYHENRPRPKDYTQPFVSGALCLFTRALMSTHAISYTGAKTTAILSQPSSVEGTCGLYWTNPRHQSGADLPTPSRLRFKRLQVSRGGATHSHTT